MALIEKRIFDSVVGHKPVIKKLLAMVQANRMPNSMLFSGATGQGKKKIAMGLAQALLCEKSEIACGVCPSCIRVYSKQSEGIILLEPDKGQIKIDAARAVVQNLSLATLGKARIVIIDEAQLLNPQAANALLKSIEEPPNNTYFILLSSSQENILKTLRSRSQVIRFPGLSRQELEEIGRVEVQPEIEKSAHYIWENLIAGREVEAIEMSRQVIESREYGQVVAQRWLEAIRNMWLNQDVIPRAQLSRLSLDVLTVDRDLKANCDVQLTFENFLRQASLVLSRSQVSEPL